MVKKDELLLSKQHVINDISKNMAQLKSENVQASILCREAEGEGEQI